MQYILLYLGLLTNEILTNTGKIYQIALPKTPENDFFV